MKIIAGIDARLTISDLGRLLRAVPRANVRDFVRHYAGQLRFLIRVQDQPAIDVEKSAGQRERVHHVGIDHLDGEGNLGVGIAHQVLPHAVHVLVDHRIVDELRALFHFLRQLFAQRDLALHRIKIQPLADVAVSDGVDVLFGAGLDVGIVFLGDRRRGQWFSWASC